MGRFMASTTEGVRIFFSMTSNLLVLITNIRVGNERAHRQPISSVSTN